MLLLLLLLTLNLLAGVLFYMSSWSEWSTCDNTCGDGEQTRSLKCPGGDYCDMIQEKQSCQGTSGCPVDGGFSEWSEWSECANAIQSRSRSCNNPAPANGGLDCNGELSESRKC